MTSLNIGNNSIGMLVPPDGWETMMSAEMQYFKSATQDWTTHVPGGAKPEGALALASAISANGAMTSLHIGKNNIPIENMNKIIAIIEAKPTMKVLCAVPFRDKTITELDVSGQSLGVEGAIVTSCYLENNGALKSLDISANNLGGWNGLGGCYAKYDTSGVKALAAAIPECK